MDTWGRETPVGGRRSKKINMLGRAGKDWMGQRCRRKTWTHSRYYWVITHVNRKGLTRSLVSRYELIRLTHWTFPEMRECFGWNLYQYVYFGGYPEAQHLISRWASLAKLRQRLFGWTIHLEGCADGYKNHEATTSPPTVLNSVVVIVASCTISYQSGRSASKM